MIQGVWNIYYPVISENLKINYTFLNDKIIYRIQPIPTFLNHNYILISRPSMKELERVNLLACQKIPVKKIVSPTKIIQDHLQEKEGLDFMFSIEI